jgi:DNA helicase-2/ATP-dependent DNA helicase PcrA
MEEGIFPHIRAFESHQEMEEERRLCYVGITRAKERLYMSYAGSRMVFGRTSRNAASRFIAEIPMSLYIATGARPASVRDNEPTIDFETRRSESFVAPRWSDLRTATATKALPSVDLPYRIGDKVRHEKFGKGTVVTIAAEDTDAKVTVAFPAPVGIKTLMASFAKLSKA